MGSFQAGALPLNRTHDCHSKSFRHHFQQYVLTRQISGMVMAFFTQCSQVKCTYVGIGTCLERKLTLL